MKATTANLIAAAPDLLEAAQAVIRGIDAKAFPLARLRFGARNERDMAYTMLLAAVAKAEGKEEGGTP